MESHNGKSRLSARCLPLEEGGAPPQSRASEYSGRQKMRIDVHAHYFPKAYLKRMESLNADPTAGAHRPLASDEPGDLEQRLKMMDAAGVEMQLLSVSPTFPQFDQEQAPVDAPHQTNHLYSA